MIDQLEKGDVFDVGFDAGLRAVIQLLEDQPSIPRQGIPETVRTVTDNFHTCKHGRYRDEPCYECLKASILDLLERRGTTDYKDH